MATVVKGMGKRKWGAEFFCCVPRRVKKGWRVNKIG